MKKLLTILTICFCCTAAHAQSITGYAALPKDSVSQKVAYTAVVQVPGSTQAELFGRATEWMARQPDKMIGGAAADPATGMQVMHLSFKQPPLSFTDTHSNQYVFAVAVYTKDGRYMYRIDDFTYQNFNPALMTKDADHRVALEYYAGQKESKHNTATLNDFNKRITAFITSLNEAMIVKKTAPKGW